MYHIMKSVMFNTLLVPSRSCVGMLIAPPMQYEGLMLAFEEGWRTGVLLEDCQCYSGAQNKGNKLFHKIGKLAVTL